MSLGSQVAAGRQGQLALLVVLEAQAHGGESGHPAERADVPLRLETVDGHRCDILRQRRREVVRVHEQLGAVVPSAHGGAHERRVRGGTRHKRRRVAAAATVRRGERGR